MESYSIWTLVFGVSHSTCFWGSPILSYISAVCSLLLQHSGPCYNFISPLMDIWVLPVFTWNIFVQIILWTYTPNPLNKYFGLELLDHRCVCVYVYMYITLLHAIKEFSKVAVPLCAPARKIKYCNCSSSSPTFLLSTFFILVILKVLEVHPCGFYSHLPNV